MTVAKRLAELGIELPEVARPVGAYVPAVRAGKLLFTAGQLPLRDGRLIAVGKVPSDVDLQHACDGATQAALNGLAAVKAQTGSLDDIAQIVRVTCFVNSAPGFADQAKVADGASELLGEVFGSAGRHTRCAIGAAELPLNAAVEVDLIVELR